MKQQIKKLYQKSKYYLPPIIFDKLNYLRAYKGFLKYKDLVTKNIDLKDKHKGERCFILGSGPSIKKEDLKPLKNEIVFALNNFYVHPDFDIIMSGEKPKYYMTAPIHPPQTEEEWKEWFSDMEKHIPKTTIMLLGLNSYKGNIKYIFDKYGLFKEHKIYWYYSGIIIDNYDFYKFNKKHIDITNNIWSSGTASVYALILAIYMGFDEIYLLGMDHNKFCISKHEEKRFYKKAIHQKGDLEIKHIKEDVKKRGDTLLFWYKIWQQYILLETMPNKNFKIINLSKGGILNVFERDILENVIKD